MNLNVIEYLFPSKNELILIKLLNSEREYFGWTAVGFYELGKRIRFYYTFFEESIRGVLSI